MLQFFQKTFSTVRVRDWGERAIPVVRLEDGYQYRVITIIVLIFGCFSALNLFRCFSGLATSLSLVITRHRTETGRKDRRRERLVGLEN